MKKQIELNVDIWTDVYNTKALESIRVEIRRRLVKFLTQCINDAPIGDQLATNPIEDNFGIASVIRIVDRK